MVKLNFLGQLAGCSGVPVGILVWGSRTLTPLRLCWPSVAEVPGECSFLQSPGDPQAPSRPPARHKLSCWQSGLPAPCAFLSCADQVVGCLFLAQKSRKRGDAKALVLARRRDAVLGSWALKLCAHCPF